MCWQIYAITPLFIYLFLFFVDNGPVVVSRYLQCLQSKSCCFILSLQNIQKRQPYLKNQAPPNNIGWTRTRNLPSRDSDYPFITQSFSNNSCTWAAGDCGLLARNPSPTAPQCFTIQAGCVECTTFWSEQLFTPAIPFLTFSFLHFIYSLFFFLSRILPFFLCVFQFSEILFSLSFNKINLFYLDLIIEISLI